MSNPHIPQDLLYDILTRLPAKSLLRFICVSKSWYSLIKDPTFITSHLHRSSNSPNTNSHLVLLTQHRQYRQVSINLYSDDETFDCYAVLDDAFFKNYEDIRVVGWCKGLICMLGRFTMRVILWNPTIRKYVTIPSGPVRHEGENIYDQVFGFGFHSSANDYKVVRIAYEGETPLEVHVYSHSIGTWQSVDATLRRQIRLQLSTAFLNDAEHWLAWEHKTFDSLIVSFDMDDQVLREIMLPSSEASSWDLKIVAHKELLTLLSFDDMQGWRSCDIWVMKEYGDPESWTKQFTIDLHLPQGLITRNHSSLGFRKNDEFFLILEGNKELATYDPKSQQITYLGIRDFSWEIYIDAYVESLVLI